MKSNYTLQFFLFLFNKFIFLYYLLLIRLLFSQIILFITLMNQFFNINLKYLNQILGFS